MTAELLCAVSLFWMQVAADADAPLENPRQPAPLLLFKFRELPEPDSGAGTLRPKLVADYGQAGGFGSSRRLRSAFPVADAPVDASGQVPVQEEPSAIHTENLNDRVDESYNSALNQRVPPQPLPQRRPPVNRTPTGLGQQDYAQLSHNVRPPQQPLPTTVAGQMVGRWFEPAREEHTARNELSLVDALEGTSDPSSRARVVSAYWQAAGSAAEERCARDELGWLNTFNEASGGANLQAAKRAAEAELLTAEVKRDDSAESLARLVHRGGVERFPLPIELPCVEAYRTHAENLLAGRSEGDDLKRLARKFNPLLNVVAARAKAVEAAEMLQRSIAEGRTGATAADVLTAYQELRHQRREFIVAVVTYNQSIARYAFGAADRGLETSRAVAMLVARPRNTARAPDNRRAGYDYEQIATPVAGEMEEPTYVR